MRSQARTPRTPATSRFQRPASFSFPKPQPAVHRTPCYPEDPRGLGLRKTLLNRLDHSPAKVFLGFSRQGARILFFHAQTVADYFASVIYIMLRLVTLEANPLWRNVVDHFGLRIAKWYGLSGKVFVSVLAAQMFAFYLSRRETIYPPHVCSLLHFLMRMGSRARTIRERLLGLFTIFAFFFAWMNVFYLYVAYINSLDNPDVLEKLPSVPVSLLILVAALATAFSLTTYRAFRRSSVPKPDAT